MCPEHAWNGMLEYEAVADEDPATPKLRWPVGDRAGRLQRRAAGRDRPLASLHLAGGGLACPAARRSILLVPSGGSKV